MVKYKQLKTTKNGFQCYSYGEKNNLVLKIFKLLLKIWTQPTNQVYVTHKECDIKILIELAEGVF
jgi:hypothetical protein